MLRIISIIIVCLMVYSKTYARSNFLVLSGGIDPSSNHYSQYLQANSLYESLQENFKGSNVDVFFAAGNRPDKKPLMADVHRTIKKGNDKIEIQLVGNIKNNRQASKDNFIEYVSAELKNNLKSNDNLFLFVSDHGSPNYSLNKNGGDYSNNCINMWKFDVNLEKESFQNSKFFEEQCLAKDELKSLLNKLTLNKTIFVMSQCYSGGFHQMAIDLDTNGIPHLNGNGKICGFTSVTEDVTASGCTSDVDGPNYQGYERGFTEELTGLDVVHGNRISNGTSSVEIAHRRATMSDFTKDIPISTSDYYLLSWARAILSKKMGSFLSKMTNYEAFNSLKGDNQFNSKANDINFNSKIGFFNKMQKVFEEKYPEYKNLLQGDLDKLNEKRAEINTEIFSNYKLIKEVKNVFDDSTQRILKGWNQYVLVTKPSYLSSVDIVAEAHAGSVAEQNGPQAVGGYLTFLSSVLTVTRPELGERINEYKSKRLEYSLSWAKGSSDQFTAELGQKIDDSRVIIKKLVDINDSLIKRRDHLRRIITYRQIVGAWNVLKKMNDQVALNELDALLECEKTSFK